MNIFLDTRAIILTLGLGYLLTLILIIAYERQNIKNLYKNPFFHAKWMQVLAWFSITLKGHLISIFATSFANSLLLISFILESIALLNLGQLLEQKRKVFYYKCTALSVIGFQLIVFFFNYDSLRIAYFSFVNALLYLPVYRIVKTKEVSPLLKTVSMMYLLFAFISLLRGIITISISANTTSIFVPGKIQFIFLMLIFIFTILSSIGYILILKEKANQRLLHYATFDYLTGTLNRRTFTERAQRMLKHYAKKGQYVSYILFDIDNFKEINDKYGHYIGDLVLQDLTSNIKELLIEKDLFGRYGGDEFALLLPGTDEKISLEKAELIKQVIQQNSHYNLPTSYTISLGILSVVPNTSTSLHSLYTRCDQALYEAKKNGRNVISRAN